MFSSFSFRLGPYAICFGLGIVLRSYVPIEILQLCIVLFGTICILGLRSWSLDTSFAWRLVSLCFMLSLGAWRANGEKVTLVSSIQDWKGEIELLEPFVPSNYGFRSKGITSDGQVLILYADSIDATLGSGSVIQCLGSSSPFRNSPYPFSFNPRTYYSYLGIAGKLRVDHFLIRERKNPDVRSSFLGSIDHWPIGIKAKSFYQAMLAGDKSGISYEDKTMFANSGIVHVLAVSGLHVGLIVYLLNILTRWRGLNKYKLGRLFRGLFVLSGLWGFVLLAGAGPSSVRSGIMFTLIFVSSLSEANGNSKEAIWYAAFLILLFDPLQLFLVGFQLSFAAVIGILYGHSVTQKSIHVFASRVKYKWVKFGTNYILSALSVSFWAQLTTLPFVIYYFHTFPNYFLLSNLLFLPVIPIFLFSGLVLAVIYETGISVDPVWRCMDTLIDWFFKGVTWVGSRPYAVSDHLYPTFQLTVGIGASIVTLLLAIHFRKWQLYACSFSIFCASFIWDELQVQEPICIHATHLGTYIEVISESESVIYGNGASTDDLFLRESQRWRKSLGVDTTLFKSGIRFNQSLPQPSLTHTNWQGIINTLPAP